MKVKVRELYFSLGSFGVWKRIYEWKKVGITVDKCVAPQQLGFYGLLKAIPGEHHAVYSVSEELSIYGRHKELSVYYISKN